MYTQFLFREYKLNAKKKKDFLFFFLFYFDLKVFHFIFSRLNFRLFGFQIYPFEVAVKRKRFTDWRHTLRKRYEKQKKKKLWKEPELREREKGKEKRRTITEIEPILCFAELSAAYIFLRFFEKWSSSITINNHNISISNDIDRNTGVLSVLFVGIRNSHNKFINQGTHTHTLKLSTETKIVKVEQNKMQYFLNSFKRLMLHHHSHLLLLFSAPVSSTLFLSCQNRCLGECECIFLRNAVFKFHTTFETKNSKKILKILGNISEICFEYLGPSFSIQSFQTLTIRFHSLPLISATLFSIILSKVKETRIQNWLLTKAE